MIVNTVKSVASVSWRSGDQLALEGGAIEGGRKETTRGCFSYSSFIETCLRVFAAIFVGSVFADLSRGELLSDQQFDGDRLDSWEVIIEGEETRIPVEDQGIFVFGEDGIHVYANANPEEKQPFAALVSKAKFERFRLTLEYRWGEFKFAPRSDKVRDAGVMYHVADESLIWPRGIECQIQEGDTGDLWSIGVQVSSRVNRMVRNYHSKGELVTRGGDGWPRYARFHRMASWERPGWNQVELLVDGDHALFKVNGQVVNEVVDARIKTEDEWVPLDTGRILLQAEGSQVTYRNVRIQTMD